MADPTAGLTPPMSGSTGSISPVSSGTAGSSGSKSLYVRTLEQGYNVIAKTSAMYDRILRTTKEINKENNKRGGVGGGSTNMFANSGVNQQADAMMNKLNEMIPASGMSAGGRAAVGAGRAALGAAAFVYSTLPNVQDAVSQRIAAQGVASMVGEKNPQKLINSSNAMLTGGMTGQYSAQLAMGTLASQGVLPGSGAYNNIMGQTAGLSVLTGMQNEQVAGAYGGINSMNFMRLGVRARDRKGNIRGPNDISNELYQRLVGKRKLTQQQLAATILAPHSSGQMAIQAAAGGDQALAQTLTEQLYFQARNGGKKLNLDPKNVKDKILGLRADDPLRKQYTYNERQAKYLQAVGGSEVGGYGTALDASGKVAEGMAGLAKVMPDVVGGMARLAGLLQTLPGAGNTGLGVAGLASGVSGSGTNMLQMGMEARAITMLGRGGGGTPGAVGGRGMAGSTGARVLGRGLGGLAALQATNMAVPYLRQQGQKHLHIKPGSAVDKTGTILGTAGGYAAGGAMIGSVIPGIGTAAGAVVGGLAGLAVGFMNSNNSPVGGDSMSPTTWAQMLLKQMSITPKDSGMVKAITNWEAHEGGHWNNSAKYNPLNTSQRMLPSDTNMNSSGVKVYSSWGEGLQATVKTLHSKNHKYEKIIDEMANGKPDDFYQSVVNSSWGTQSLMGHVRSKGSHKKTGKPHVNNGVYNPPANGPKTAHFGQKPRVKGKYWTQYGYHTGQDYGVPVGTSVKAYKAGKVIHAGDGGSRADLGSSWGKAILVDHGTHRSLYAHLSHVGVRAGDKVRPGQQIALSGNTGAASQGPHLHFEIRKGGKPVDPIPYLGGGSSGSLTPSNPTPNPNPGSSPAPSTGTTSTNNFTTWGTGVAPGTHGGTHKASVPPYSAGPAAEVVNTPSSLTNTKPRMLTTSAGLTNAAAAATQLSVSNLGVSSGYGSVNTALGGSSSFSANYVQADYSGFGGDANPPSVGSFDPVGTSLQTRSSGGSHGDHGITINMNISIANADTSNAVNMAKEIKTILERELRDSKIRNY